MVKNKEKEFIIPVMVQDMRVHIKLDYVTVLEQSTMGITQLLIKEKCQKDYLTEKDQCSRMERNLKLLG